MLVAHPSVMHTRRCLVLVLLLLRLLHVVSLGHHMAACWVAVAHLLHQLLLQELLFVVLLEKLLLVLLLQILMLLLLLHVRLRHLLHMRLLILLRYRLLLRHLLLVVRHGRPSGLG